MQNNQQQAYDRGITIFSPDGRLYQVEYAREAVERGSASVGVRAAEGVVLAANRQTRSPLIERESIEKIHAVDDHVGVASAGHVADARQLVDVARQQAQVEELRYGQPIGVETLTKELTDHVQQYTQTGGARPFGAALLVGGIENGEPRLFETDPSGTSYEWQATAVACHSYDVPEGSVSKRRGSPFSIPPTRSAAPKGRAPPVCVYCWTWSVSSFVSVSTPIGWP